MGDDEFLKELKAVAQEETDLHNLPGDELLDQLAEGTISEQDLTRLEAMAAEDERVALAMKAFAPLGHDFEAQMADKLLAMVGGEERETSSEPARELSQEPEKPSFFEWLQNLFKFENPVFGPVLAGAAALAMVAVFYPGADSPLGRYTLEATQGDAQMRGKNQEVVDIPSYTAGSQVQLLLRPDQTGDDNFVVRVFLATKTEFEPLQVTTQISSTGAVRISGMAGTAFPAKGQPYQVVSVVSRFEDTPDASTIRQAVLGQASTEGEHWQILSTEIQVK